MDKPAAAIDDGRRWRHVPALDGVRGVAVVAVLLFHGGVSWARGGFLGVDAFFVLSGFLITSLLLDEIDRSGTIGLGHFWSRRARRLLPALFVVLAAAGLYGAWLAPPGSLEGLRKDALATLLYVANWRYIAAGTNYFEATAAPSILRHTWSLAVEEQFYLGWPLVMFAISRARRSAALAWTATVAALGALASAVAMAVVFTPNTDTSRAYFGTDTHVQVVLVGCLLAAIVAKVRRSGGVERRSTARTLGFSALAGAAVFLAATAIIEGTEPALFRGGFLVVSVAVAAVLAHIVLVPSGWSARALAWRPLRAAGLISYGLYLWHWPVYLTLTRARTGLDGPTLLGVRVTASVAVALVSYFAVELPIRRGSLPRGRAAVAVALAACLVVAAVVLGTRLPTLPASAQTVSVGRTASGYPASRRPPLPRGRPAKVLVVGDSVAKTLADDLVRPARRSGLAIVNRGVLGCGLARGGPLRYFGRQMRQPGDCDSWPQQWAADIRHDNPDIVFVIVGRWEVMDRIHDGRWMALGQPAFDRYIDGELDHAIRILTAGNATVALATAPYYFRGERPDGGRWPEDDPARVDRFNAILRSVAARHADRVAVLDLNGQTSRGGRYTPVIDRVSLRYDGVHFSPAGARWLSPWLLGALAEMAPASSGLPAATTTPPPTGSVTTTRRAPTTTAAPSTTTEPPATTEPPPTEPPSTTEPPTTRPTIPTTLP